MPGQSAAAPGDNSLSNASLVDSCITDAYLYSAIDILRSDNYRCRFVVEERGSAVNAPGGIASIGTAPPWAVRVPNARAAFLFWLSVTAMPSPVSGELEALKTETAICRG